MRFASRRRAGAGAGRRGGGGGRGGSSTVPTRYRGGGGGGGSGERPPSLRAPSPLPEALLPKAPEPRGSAAANSGEGLWRERGFPGSADCRDRREVRTEGQVSPARAGSARLAASELGRNSDRRPRACCGGPSGGRAEGLGRGLGPRSVQLWARAPAVLWPPLAGGSEAPRSGSLRFPGRCAGDGPRRESSHPKSSWCLQPLPGISLAGLASDGLCSELFPATGLGRLLSPLLRRLFSHRGIVLGPSSQPLWVFNLSVSAC